jgi:hypothetical protein
MLSMKNWAHTLIVAAAIVAGTVVFSVALVAVKKAQNNYITVTGSATRNFTSDLVVWGGSFSKNKTLIFSIFRKASGSRIGKTLSGAKDSGSASKRFPVRMSSGTVPVGKHRICSIWIIPSD